MSCVIIGHGMKFGKGNKMRPEEFSIDERVKVAKRIIKDWEVEMMKNMEEKRGIYRLDYEARFLEQVIDSLT